MSKQNATYIVQDTGESIIQWQYPKDVELPGGFVLSAGVVATLTGFKLDSQTVTTSQAISSSVIIPLLDSGSIQLTNANEAGSISFTVIRTGVVEDNSKVDIAALAWAQRASGDSTGATITVEWRFNGNTYKIQFNHCTVVDCPPLFLSGNDMPDYTVTYNYSDYRFTKWGSSSVASPDNLSE